MRQKIKIKLLLEAPPRSYSLKPCLNRVRLFSAFPAVWVAVQFGDFIFFSSRRKAERFFPGSGVSC